MKVDIESAIGPGGRIAVAWFKSYASIYVLKRSIWSITYLKIVLVAIVKTVYINFHLGHSKIESLIGSLVHVVCIVS